MTSPRERIPEKLRILFLTYEFPDSESDAVVSGEVKNPYLLACGLADAGHYLHVISVPFLTRRPRAVSRRASGRFQVVDVPEGRGWGVLRYVWRSFRVAKQLAGSKTDYDVIHAEAPALALGVVLARAVNRRFRRVRLVTSGHGTNLPEADADAAFNLKQRLRTWNARLVLPVDRAAFRASDAIISVSDFQRQELAHLYRVPERRIWVIHNGVDLRRYSPRGKVGRPPEAPRLLFVGRLVPKKGLQHLIRSLPELTRRNPGLQLEVVGGSEVFDTYGSALRAIADACKVSDQIGWMMAVPEVGLPAVYRRADVAVFPSEGYESLPTVVLEAMACGVPVVATRAWGTPEALGPDHAGLIPEGDTGALVEAIDAFLSSTELRDRTIADQLRRVSEFSLDRVISSHEEVYRNVE